MVECLFRKKVVVGSNALAISLTCFICFCLDNISNFAVIKSLRKFGGCLVDDHTFFLKADFKFSAFNSIL